MEIIEKEFLKIPYLKIPYLKNEVTNDDRNNLARQIVDAIMPLITEMYIKTINNVINKSARYWIGKGLR